MRAKTHCPKGHPYSGKNLYVDPGGTRFCRTCRIEHGRRHRARREIYVDPIVKWPTSIRCFKAGYCHLMADTFKGLHAFAKRLGLHRAWFRTLSLHPHYDLTVDERARAVGLGATEVSREFVPGRRGRKKES